MVLLDAVRHLQHSAAVAIVKLIYVVSEGKGLEP